MTYASFSGIKFPKGSLERLRYPSTTRNRIPARQQLGPTPCKYLRPGLYDLQIIRCRQLFIRLQILIESKQIPAIAGSICLRHKAVDSSGAICADDEVKDGVADFGRCGGSGRVAVVTEGTDTAVDTKPDHYLVGLCGGAGCTDESVVSDVCAEGGAGVARVSVSI